MPTDDRADPDETPSLGTEVRAALDRDAALRGDELQPGAHAGAWTIRAAIATGGCGRVYAADHRVLRRPAAIKVLHLALASSPELVERFIREARIVNRIRHPNIVDISDFGH